MMKDGPAMFGSGAARSGREVAMALNLVRPDPKDVEQRQKLLAATKILEDFWAEIRRLRPCARHGSCPTPKR